VAFLLCAVGSAERKKFLARFKQLGEIGEQSCRYFAVASLRLATRAIVTNSASSVIGAAGPDQGKKISKLLRRATFLFIIFVFNNLQH